MDATGKPGRCCRFPNLLFGCIRISRGSRFFRTLLFWVSTVESSEWEHICNCNLFSKGFGFIPEETKLVCVDRLGSDSDVNRENISKCRRVRDGKVCVCVWGGGSQFNWETISRWQINSWPRQTNQPWTTKTTAPNDVKLFETCLVILALMGPTRNYSNVTILN